MIQMFRIPYIRNILVLSLVVAMSIPLLDSFFIYPAFKHELIKQTENEAIRVANALSSNLGITREQIKSEQLSRILWPELKKMTTDYGLMKLKIFSSEGVVVYSTHPKDMGLLNQRDYFTEIVMKGRVYTKVVQKNETSMEDEIIVRDVVETYVPLLEKGNFVGAFEIYYDITQNKQNLETLLKRAYRIVGFMLVILCAGLILTSGKAAKIYMAQLEAEKALRQHQHELDHVIALRTKELQEANLHLKDEISERQKKQAALKKTTRKLRETLEELKTTQANMLQSEKMASIGQLAAGVAHEINNPVGFIKSNLATIEEYRQDIWTQLGRLEKYKAAVQNNGPTLDKEIQMLAASIDAAADDLDLEFIAEDFESVVLECKEGIDRIARIVADLKNFSHADTGEIDYFDLNEGINSTLNIVWNELKYKATVSKELGDIPMVKGNRHQINQVVMNLLVNAAQSIEKKGTICIATRQVNHHVEMTFSDTGCGIPPDLMSRIYDPFFTTKEVGQGTGLGLNVVYNIIKNHGGVIDVQSEPNQGTTFSIRVPVDGVEEKIS